jgi:energy-coupling factor transporter ATP-binding protein EcfA2
MERGILVLHSSYVIHDGKAILFSGDCGCGKSTQAALWEQYRQAEIINGDRSLVYCRDGKVYAGGHFHCGTSGIRKNKSAELKAIVLLSQSIENKVSFPKGVESFQKILSQCAYDVEKREEIEMVTQLVAQLVQNARVLKFSCRKDVSAVEALESVILQSEK